MLKRERVVPFDGEENFVVPKKGGFGQPDNENYVMVQSKDANFSYLTAPLTLGDTPPTRTPQTLSTTLESGSTTSTISPNQTQTITSVPPTTISTDTPPSTTPQTTTSTITDSPTTTITPIAETLPPEKTQAQIDCEATGGTWVKGGCNKLTLEPIVLPTFPDWSTLDCASLTTQIASLQSTMATSRFANSTIADAYNNALATAQSTFTTKCPTPSTNVNVSVTTPTATIPPIVSGGGGVFGGGGGGGIGEPPTDEVPTTEVPQTSGKKTWLLLLVIVGGLYLLTRKKSS